MPSFIDIEILQWMNPETPESTIKVVLPANLLAGLGVAVKKIAEEVKEETT